MRISDWSSDVCSSDLRFANAHDCCSDPVGSVALAGNYRVAGIAHGLRQLSLIQFAASVGEVGQQQSADADGRHQPDLAVAMLAEHKRIDAARCDIEFYCQQCAQAEIGRASCRERVWQSVEIAVVAESLKKK